ncbi:hypothetical protein K1T71_003082 [Dendrolimus kikuchii]|uniref:Uncharacterized protein n=1 Tax=Dendrolimus kikuchii TaxID=765133 RepID=A0ACC1DC48_9NEOP|nr:hypothetical protein K1T71_003082 [Dendrolimus kikuchii]
MKKVRFETPDKFNSMNNSECHSPRPFIERQVCADVPNINNISRIVPFSTDPVQRFDFSNSSPYPIAMRTLLPSIPQHDICRLPSNELDLSMLDIWTPCPKPPRPFCKPVTKNYNEDTPFCGKIKTSEDNSPPVLTAIEHKSYPPNVLMKDNDFFIRRGNIHKFKFDSYPLHDNLDGHNSNKENNPMTKKVELMRRFSSNNIISSNNDKHSVSVQVSAKSNTKNDCRCYHCKEPVLNTQSISPPMSNKYMTEHVSPCLCTPPQPRNEHYCNCHYQPVKQTCICNNLNCGTPKQNAVDKKNWAIERYEQTKMSEHMEVEKQTNVAKEKREPTVADLFKIIKLQNEQLQMLQEKVDKFISANTQGTKEISERIVEQVTNEQHKISIGVMTSFEMVRTSTVINKEIVTQAKENSQIQCNKSQISIKEVVAKAQPVNLNFLDGIAPIAKPVEATQNCVENQLNDDKTLNEYSLYNVQVDNATTPMISPEHSMYLDVRDYSDSDASSDDQSNVGWTYYNKVMTQVNGMLQDSDMPSSASALYRNTKQKCVQMQIDKTNVSVTKRVKFGDDPLGIHQSHIYTASTDTSLKMNQLATKYLKQAQPQLNQRHLPKQVIGSTDMSIGTKNYMERHKLIQAGPLARKSPPLNELPKFLDITTLKQQPKLL